MTLATNVANLATRIGTEFKSVRASIGTLSSLSTTDKTSLVAALNEVKAAEPVVTAASTTAAGTVRLATTAEATSTTPLATIAVTPAGLKAGLDAMVNAAPGTLDTLSELANALGNNPNYATTIASQIAAIGDPTTDFVATFNAALV